MEKQYKSGIIVVPGYSKSPMKNIGDYVQSYAALQFVPYKDEVVFLDRDEIDTALQSGEGKVRVVMNGWWMGKPWHFPPSQAIEPLYVSFHLTPGIEKTFFSEKTILHLKKYAPIGCRDTNTVKMMNRHGIDAYFSGCLTLTLGNTFRHQVKDDAPVYIVDLYVGKFMSRNIKSSLFLMGKALVAVLFNGGKVQKIAEQIRKTSRNHQSPMASWRLASKVWAIYSKAFDFSVLSSAIYEEHNVSKTQYPTEEERMDIAREQLEKYSQAKYVITSRIHCGLPCLGMGTPVVLVTSPSIMKSGRVGGLYDFFKKGTVDDCTCKLNSEDFPQMDKIGLNDTFENYTKHVKYADELSKKAKEFYMQEK